MQLTCNNSIKTVIRDNMKWSINLPTVAAWQGFRNNRNSSTTSLCLAPNSCSIFLYNSMGVSFKGSNVRKISLNCTNLFVGAVECDANLVCIFVQYDLTMAGKEANDYIHNIKLIYVLVIQLFIHNARMETACVGRQDVGR